jgi:hypothetical protein
VSSGRLLVVAASSQVDEAALREAVRQHAGTGEAKEAEVHILAPAPASSWLHRLTGDVDKARAKAEEVARQAAEAVEGMASVEAEVGDPELVQAIEDALRSFPAEELIVVTPASTEADWLDEADVRQALERFGLPVTYLTAGRA